SKFALAIQPPGRPENLDLDLPHVIAVRGANRGAGDIQLAGVSQPDVRGALRVISRDEVARNKSTAINLVPTVEANRLDFLEHDLGCAKIFPRHAHGESP